MAAYTPQQLRNVALVAHNGSGKTALADAMFHVSGQTNRLGRVDDKTSSSDFEPEEHKRGASIQTTILPCPWNDHKINVLDTPGYPDFRGEMLSALRVADVGVVVVSASAGIEVGASQAWEACEQRGLPRLIVINKLDRENTEFTSMLDTIAAQWGRNCVAVQAPNGAERSFTGVVDLITTEETEGPVGDLRERLIEAVAESDDELAEKYLEEETLDVDTLRCGLKAAVASGSVFPVIASSALNEVGVRELLDTIVALVPSPTDRTAEDVPGDAQANLVFKTSADPFVGKISYYRVYGAPMKGDQSLWNERRGENERIGQLFEPRGKEQSQVDQMVTGDIGGVAKLTVTRTGDTLSEKSRPITLSGVDRPEPVFGLAVTPKSQADLDKMADAIQRIAEEDPSLRVDRDPDTKETVIRGLGDVHVETAVERIERKFGVHLQTALPKIPYRETVSASTRTEYKHKKQSGGHGQYGHVIMQVAPLDRGDGFTFETKVVGGNVPKEYIPSVEKGIRKAMGEGVLAGFPVVDVGVTLLDGSSHSVDSSGMAFEIAGSFALRKGVQEAKPILLEPVMKVTVIAPDDLTGEVIGDLNTRRAHILGMTPRGDGATVIEADVPVATMQRYATNLRSITQARAVFSAEFGYYAPVPQQETEKVIAQQKEKEAVTA